MPVPRHKQVTSNLEPPTGPEDSRATPLGGMDHGTVTARVHVAVTWNCTRWCYRYSSAPWAFQTAHLARQEAHARRRAVAEGAALARPRR